MDDLTLNPDRWRYVAQAENSLAGCLLVEPEKTLHRVRGIITAGDFQSETARQIYMAAASLVDSGQDCDPVLIQAEAAKHGIPLDGRECADLMNLCSTTANAAETARKIHEAATARTGRAIGRELAEEEITPLEALGKLQQLLAQQNSSLHTPEEAAQSFMDYVVAAAEGKTRPFISTGYNSLDEQLAGGLVTSGLITLAARPGMGKTTAALNIADHVAAAGGNVLYISLEMDENQLWSRRAACISGLNYSNIYKGKINQENGEWQRLMEATNTLTKRNLVIRQTPATIEDIEREARCREGLTLLVVDHLGLAQKTGKPFSRYDFVTECTHRLKQLALSLKIPILALCQLNRASEQRSDKQPSMADLRDSGAIEEDSDVVCLLFREADYYSEENKPKPWEAQTIDFIIAKNRHGSTGTVTLKFYGINSRIIEEVYCR